MMQRILFLPCAAALLGGCATVDDEVPYLYELSAAAATPVPIHVAFETFADHRPTADRLMTGSLSDVDQRVTATVLRDFRASRVFASHAFPARRPGGAGAGEESESAPGGTGGGDQLGGAGGDDQRSPWVVRGEIKRFYWKQTPNLLTFMPGMAVLLVGADMPLWWVEAGAEIKLSLLHPRSGDVLAEYSHADARVISTGWKEWQDGRWGLELADSLKAVADGLKAKIAANPPKLAVRAPGGG